MADRVSKRIKDAQRTLTQREKARAFLDEVELLCEKYDLINTQPPDGPSVCHLGRGNNRITVFVKWEFEESSPRPDPQQQPPDRRQDRNQGQGQDRDSDRDTSSRPY